MKKVLLVVALILVLDAVAVVLAFTFCWHPLLRLVATGMVRRGNVLEHQHSYADAMAQYNRALQFDPANVHAYVGRAYAHVSLGEWDAALADADRAIALDPQSGAAHGARGWVHESKGDWDGAHADYDKAIECQPNGAVFYAHRGWVRFHQHEPDGAMRDLDQALKLAPHLALGYHERAWLKMENDDLPGALEDEDAAVEFAPRNAACYLRRADFRLQADDTDGALADAKEALTLEPRSAEGLYWEAVALRRNGDPAGSVLALDQILQINPAFPGVLFERAMARYVAGDLAAAASDFCASRKDGATRARAELWLWIVTAESGAKDEANRVLDDYLAETRDVQGNTWPERLGDLLLGRTTATVLTGLPDLNKIGKEQRDRLCELWFYAAKVALLQGDKAGAKNDLKAAVDTKAADIVEYSEAKRELAGL